MRKAAGKVETLGSSPNLSFFNEGDCFSLKLRRAPDIADCRVSLAKDRTNLRVDPVRGVL
jgi:hypothetical protein